MASAKLKTPFDLTQREYEILKFAYEQGYFEHGTSCFTRPKVISVTEIAEKMGISQGTFSDQLSNARRKILFHVCSELFKKEG